jgi:hypothetical protein
MRLGRDFRIRILGSGELWASSAQVGFLDTRVFGEGFAVAGKGNLVCLTWLESALEFKHERPRGQSHGTERHCHDSVPRAAAARENCIAQPGRFHEPAGIESGPGHVETTQA